MFKNFLLVHKKTLKFFLRTQSTIYALSSGQGKCGVAVIRVSGASTELALQCLTGLSNPKPRTAILRSIKHPSNHEILDKGLILWFPGPHSFTGEDCCEFHVHGGIAVVNSVLNALGSLPDLRLAEPGEFTRRAFHNGKLDLTEVEGLADLLQAETEIQRKQAFLQTQGALSKLYNKWRGSLIKSVAHIEAHIDFEETETIDEGVLEHIVKEIETMRDEIDKHLNDGRKGELLRNGVKTVILGEPNVGKSSLLNLLCKRPAAIVTPVEGTTRDILEVTLNIEGYPLVLADTAGLRTETDDIVEKEGIIRAKRSYECADLVILVIDSEKYYSWLHNHSSGSTTDYLKFYVEKLGLHDLLNYESNDEIFTKECIIVFNKLDLVENSLNLQNSSQINCLSCKSEDGVPDLVNSISNKLKVLCGEPSAEHPSMNQVRHRQHLSNCLKCLNSSLEKSSNDTVLMAESLRKALRHLGYLVGVTTTEQLLDVIFKDFCIGK
ncbi:tRNA modification GTPase GTPBP3, mitochondrial [Tribolium madens]|uniref:tRNA modification GTPase GTPBP3, mitochondrial n=1 Tax=Tribolium madens TaxID=41895 RepID=UPI001CF74DE0|nr:tRNA modification GTPase GTPBP3, mitochondrial [Tribolium madens]